jgi:hypothetical protein
MVTDGTIASADTKFTVMISPGFASSGSALLESIETVVSEGPVLSYTTLLLLVVAVTAAPALPARSLNEMLNGMLPGASAAYHRIHGFPVIAACITYGCWYARLLLRLVLKRFHWM